MNNSFFSNIDPEGEAGIAKRGHRGYIGGRWEVLGNLQFNFLKNKGLRPDCYLLDIACGSLRLGVKVIPYLERGHYLGIEKERGLVKAGLEQELDSFVRSDKRPHIEISSSFEFEKFNQKANFAIAQSLFTHLPSDLINECFKKLYPWLEDDGVFYATFHETKTERDNPLKPHAFGYFVYTQAQMRNFGEENGFSFDYIGDWNHPNQQVIVEYRKSKA